MTVSQNERSPAPNLFWCVDEEMGSEGYGREEVLVVTGRIAYYYKTAYLKIKTRKEVIKVCIKVRMYGKGPRPKGKKGRFW